MKLYTYFRSSAAYRVRIGLALKGLEATPEPVHLVRNGGEQHKPAYREVNPLGLVPALLDAEQLVTESIAILEYLEETHPEPPLLPRAPVERARVRAFAQTIACDIHPLNNLRVLRYLKHELGVADQARDDWYRHWIAEGFRALETELTRSRFTGRFCHGDAPSLADVCLVPQVYNARRFACPLEEYPTILRIDEVCRALPAFQRAAPEAQPDAE